MKVYKVFMRNTGQALEVLIAEDGRRKHFPIGKEIFAKNEGFIFYNTIKECVCDNLNKYIFYECEFNKKRNSLIIESPFSEQEIKKIKKLIREEQTKNEEEMAQFKPLNGKKIIHIKEVFGVCVKNGVVKQVDENGCWDGFEIKTDTTKIYLLVSNGQQCCENFGLLRSDSDLEYFVGKNILKIEATNTRFETSKLAMPLVGMNKYAGLFDDKLPRTMFITITTLDGCFQFGVYNAHNGFYGHVVRIIQNNIIMTERTI